MTLKSLLIILAVFVCCVIAAVIGIAVYTLYLLIRRPLIRFYRQRASEADFCPYAQIPVLLIDFVVQTEDAFFFSHRGVMIKTIRQAIRRNRREHKIVMGGSTITQQLMKNLYFHFEHNYLRKLVEAILSIHAEHVLGKEKILELYLNIIYFGNGQYGISDAAYFYFNKRMDELSTNQMFMLACMPHAPTATNPIKHPDVFLRVRNKKLAIVYRGKAISDRDMELVQSYTETNLDPELRACGPEERAFPDTIVMINERFGLAQKYPWQRVR